MSLSGLSSGSSRSKRSLSDSQEEEDEEEEKEEQDFGVATAKPPEGNGIISQAIAAADVLDLLDQVCNAMIDRLQ